MKILAYLAFTMLSVMIQFCIIDYIQAKLEGDELKPKQIYLNNTSQKKFVDIIREYAGKPHALYYRTENAKLLESLENMPLTTVSSDGTLSENTTTGPDNPQTSTVYDFLYEETVTGASESPSTSELPVTTTEFENITDFTIFNTNNATDTQNASIPKKTFFQEDCYCNLMYRLCDINCCCDGECTDNERSLFNCTEKGIQKANAHFCLDRGTESSMLGGIDNLFCVVKSNLPEKRNIIHERYNVVEVSRLTENTMKWHDKSEPRIPIALSPKLYSHGDPVWVLRNNTVTYIDFPVAEINGNCDNRAPIYFLDEQQVQCNVVLGDLEMFNILKTINETKVISVKSKNISTSNLNCSELHCTDLKIIVCNETICTNFSREWHEPYCTDNMDGVCKNIATKVDYIFYYWNSTIVDAILQFHIQSVLSKVQFIRQEIRVKFYFAESSNKQVVTLSGNPGYLKGHPLIASFENDNYTRNFFSNGSKLINKFYYPGNRNGICFFTNNTNFVIFGTNKRNKCRYVVPSSTNSTGRCEEIQKDIKNLLGISRRAVISGLGNPHGQGDEDWIVLFTIDKLDDKPYEMPTVGDLRGKRHLTCYNMVTKVSLYFGFADVSEVIGKEKLKILTALAYLTTQNITFTQEQSSVVLTFETNFADITKPPAYKYAGSPQLNIHLPKDFFFPFPSNNCYRLSERNVATVVISLVLTFIPK